MTAVRDGEAGRPAGLVAHLDDFVRAVRQAGVPIGISDAIDAARAMVTVDLLDREQLRHGLAAVLLKRPTHRPAFDALFDLWWPRSISNPPGFDTAAADGKEWGAQAPDRDPDAADPGLSAEELTDAMRAQLAQLLLDGDDAALRRFAEFAVERLGQGGPSPGGQSFFSYRVLRALSPDTLVASLLQGLLGGQERGGLAEQVARQTIRERLATFRSHVESEVRRRAAEQRGKQNVARTAVTPLADQVDFLRAQHKDLAELRRSVTPLARRLATRLAARRRHGRRGRLDFRRTVRASLATGGVPLVTAHRPRRVHKPELVVLCDVSGSVAGFSHFTLLLTAALREQFSGVRAFAFVDTCDEVTRFFAPGSDVADAVQRIGREARVVWFDGHSDYGHSLETFAEQWPTVVGPRTSLLILGDARTNYRNPGLPTLGALVKRARHAYWLNPEPRRQWGSGDSAADDYAELIEMVECRTAQQLTDFITRL
ncbi:MAG: VWA domain-containing protein [Geodermatophilaceae bacterium]|nr:VWA domain-containing protein [Geodermatophilaceae bacterium]